MSSFSDYLENKVLDHVFGNTALVSPTTVYLALFTANPTDAGGAAASGVAASVIEHVPAFSGMLGKLAPVAQTVALVAAAVLLAYFFWRRLK